MTEGLTAEQRAALDEAYRGTVTPYSQIRESLAPAPGQYDFVVRSLEPQIGRNGLYCIAGEFQITAPESVSRGPGSLYLRTLYIGTHKDPMAKLPETRLNSPGLRFLKRILTANKLSAIDQTDEQLCNSLLDKGFGCRIEETEYTGADGAPRKGTEFGRNVTPVGVLPPRLDGAPAAMPNGPDTTGGLTFGIE